MRPSLFNNSLSVNKNSSSGLDLREEMDIILFGDANNSRKGFPLVVRHLRRDNQGKPVACECKDLFSGDGLPSCSYCDGESWLWDEEWYMGRSQFLGSGQGFASRYKPLPMGDIKTDYKIFFLRWDNPIELGDKIVEMRLDREGNPVVPYVRSAIYRPETIDYLRDENGRVEFITAYCLEKDAVRSDTLV